MTTIINVGDLPKPEVIETLDFETTVSTYKAKFVEFWDAVRTANPALGLPEYDVANLETDPAVILIEAESYRDMLIRARVNDAVRAVLPAFATGTDLDAIAARANVVRLVTAVNEDGEPTAYETDKQLLDRYLAAFAAPAAGSEDGYIFQAATAWPARHDIKVLDYSDEPALQRGDVVVVLLAAAGQTPSDDDVTKVITALGPKSARPMTDVVSVRRATVVPYRIEAKLILPRGASPANVVAARRAAAQSFADRRYFIGGRVTVSGAISALWDANVSNIIVTEPVADVTWGVDKAPRLTELVLTYEVEE